MTIKIEERIAEYQKERDALGFLDLNMWIGKPLEAHFVSDYPIGELKKHIQRYEIKGGIVSHFSCIEYDSAWGNEQLWQAIAGSGLFGAVVLTPEMFYDPIKGREILKNSIAKGARLARVFPKHENFEFRPWCIKHLLDNLLEFHLPLMIWQTETTWNDIDEVCCAYPDLTVIIEGNPQKILYHNRRFYPLLENHENVKLEMHNVIGYLGVEDLVKHFGAERLMFGSNLPLWDPNCTMMSVTHARVSEEEKHLMAHGNLEKLINHVKLQ